MKQRLLKIGSVILSAAMILSNFQMPVIAQEQGYIEIVVPDDNNKNITPPPDLVIAECPHSNKQIDNVKAATCSEYGYTGDTICVDCGEIINKGSVINKDPFIHTRITPMLKNPLFVYCLNCKSIVDNSKSLSNDDHSSVGCIDIEATCMHKGYKDLKYCSICQKILDYGTELAVNENNHEDDIQNTTGKRSTCIEKAHYSEIICSECKKVVQEAYDAPLDPNNHTNIEISSVSANCVHEGFENKKVCKDCGKIIDAGTITPVNPDNHENITYKMNAKSTCSTAGKDFDKICSDCGKIIEEGQTLPLNPNNHQHLTVLLGSEATCKKEGKETSVICKDCGKVISGGAIIPINPDNHKSLVMESQLNPTCTEDGREARTYCKDCGITIKGGATIPKTGHHYELIQLKKATESEDGYNLYMCNSCEDLKNEVVKKTINNSNSDYDKNDQVASTTKKENISESTIKDFENMKNTSLTIEDEKYNIKKDENEEIVINNIISDKAEIVIPNEIQINGVTYPVTSIEKKSFIHNKNLKKVILGKNIVKLENSAFEDCTNLKEVILSKNLIMIGDKAFYNCKNLKSITIPKETLVIGNSAFMNCKKLNKVSFYKKSKLVSLGKNVFSNTAITKIVLPDNLTQISDNTFKGCNKLKTATISKNIVKIGKGSFWGCKKLNKLSIKTNNLKKIGKDAFKSANKNLKIVAAKSQKDRYRKLINKARK